MKYINVNTRSMKHHTNLTDYKSTVVFYGENPITQKTLTWNTWGFALFELQKNGKTKFGVVSW